VTRKRLLILILGPVAILAGVYALCVQAKGRDEAIDGSAAVSGDGPIQGRRFDEMMRRSGNEDLEERCWRTATDVLQQLPEGMQCRVKPPFLLVGEYSEGELEELYVKTVLPVTRCLWRSYFDRGPDAPITVIVLKNEQSYSSIASSLDGYTSTSYSGYTQRGQRRIVVNLASGPGILVHELTHVLALFDFPDMPEWFDEGLASLHEDAILSDDGLQLIGVDNWRSRILNEAVEQNQLPTLDSIVNNHKFRGTDEGLNYAVVRAFCNFLQDRGLLSHFYRKLRDRKDSEPGAAELLCALFDVDALAEIDRLFREWQTERGP
jgi:hypothetical protein